MSNELNDVAPSVGEVSTLYVALEVSASSWVVGIGDPELDKVGMHKLAPADTGCLLEKIGKTRAVLQGPRHVAGEPPFGPGPALGAVLDLGVDAALDDL